MLVKEKVINALNKKFRFIHFMVIQNIWSKFIKNKRFEERKKRSIVWEFVNQRDGTSVAMTDSNSLSLRSFETTLRWYTNFEMTCECRTHYLLNIFNGNFNWN